MPNSISSNAELAQLLVELRDELSQLGENDLSQDAWRASRHLLGSPSEFLHESSVALTKIQRVCSVKFSTDRNAQIKEALKLIEEAFRRVGGA